jgi:hypothetical protein
MPPHQLATDHPARALQPSTAQVGGSVLQQASSVLQLPLASLLRSPRTAHANAPFCPRLHSSKVLVLPQQPPQNCQGAHQAEENYGDARFPTTPAIGPFPTEYDARLLQTAKPPPFSAPVGRHAGWSLARAVSHGLRGADLSPSLWLG